MWKVPLFELNYDNKESEAVQNVLDSKWLTMGEQTNTFEKKFTQMLKDKNVKSTFVSNCTSALLMSLLTLDLKNEEEVIIPALTFVADLNTTLMAGGKPILADCENLNNWNMTADTIRPLITSKTRAVIIVHLAGFPCDMDPILALCKEHNLILIEDVAHAPGAIYKGKVCGTMGDFGCFSFFTNKNLSIGEGGMLTTRHIKYHDHIKAIRSHGMSTLTLDRHKGRAITYDVTRPGLNFRSDEIHAALGLVQLKKLNKANKKRANIYAYYQKKLSDIIEISIPFNNQHDTQAVYHIFPILLDKKLNREKIIKEMKADGIQTSIHYPSFHQFSAFKQNKLNATPVSEEISRRELTLPLYPDLKKKQVDLIVDSIHKAIKNNL